MSPKQGLAFVAVVAGAGVSVFSMLRVGHRAPRLLLVLFAIWVLAPFTALAWANIRSKRWSVVTRATLHTVTLVLTFSSLIIYGDAVLRPAKSTPAFVFMVVPLGSWLLMTIVVPIAALISGRLSRRSAGAHTQSSPDT